MYQSQWRKRGTSSSSSWKRQGWDIQQEWAPIQCLHLHPKKLCSLSSYTQQLLLQSEPARTGSWSRNHAFFPTGFSREISSESWKIWAQPKSFFFFFGQYFIDQNGKSLGFILFWLCLDIFVARGVVFFSTIVAWVRHYDVVFSHRRVADTSTTVSNHNRARVVFVQLVKWFF